MARSVVSLKICLTFAVLVSTQIFYGCTYSYQTVYPNNPYYRSRDVVNAKLGRDPVDITLQNGHTIKNVTVTLGQDSVAWDDPISGRPLKVPNSEVREITTKQHLSGLVDGMLIGTVVGAGVFLGGAASYVPLILLDVDGLAWVSVSQIPLFMIIGGIKGRTVNYEFPRDSTVKELGISQ